MRFSRQDVSARDCTSCFSRLELGEEFICEVMVRVEVLLGQDDRVAGQAVAQRVQAGVLLAGFGLGTG